MKDAIVDQFRENTGERPNISVSNPDIRLNIHVAEDNATLSLDSSGGISAPQGLPSGKRRGSFERGLLQE